MSLDDRISEEVTRSLEKRNMAIKLDDPMQVSKQLFTEVAQEAYLAVYSGAEIIGNPLMKKISDNIRERGYTTQTVFAQEKPGAQINTEKLRKSAQEALDQTNKLQDDIKGLQEKIAGLIAIIDSTAIK